MKKLLSIVFVAFIIGCSDREQKHVTVRDEAPLAIIDGIQIDRKAIEKQIDFRMGIFEVNRLLNFAMRRMDLQKVRTKQQEKFARMAKDEVLFKSLLSAAAKKKGIIARPEDITRIRGQYELNLGRRAGTYSIVTATVDKVGFLREFNQFIEEEARVLSYVRSLHPEVGLDIGEPEIDEYIAKLQEKEKRSADFNAKIYQTATNVLLRLKAGEDFAKLAKEFSCAADKEDGGDMGDIILTGESAYSNYAPAYVSALMMKDGAFSEVVSTPLGVEIFQVVASRPQENPEDPIIKNIRHICFELRASVGAYTRDTVRRRLIRDQLKTLYGEATILTALSEVQVQIPGVADVKGYFLNNDSKEDR